MRYQREEPLKYGRLLRVPGYLPTVQMKAARTTRARYTRRTMVQAGGLWISEYDLGNHSVL